jgi:DNA-binding response OmpR family regulator
MIHGTVLYIEDDPTSLQLVERLLEQRPGVELLTALEGKQGLTLARERRPTIILLDLHLQDMEGEDVLRAIRETPELRRTQVILLTAEPYPRLPERMRAAGAQAYLRKPLRFDEFFAAIDAAIQRGDASGPTP